MNLTNPDKYNFYGTIVYGTVGAGEQFFVEENKKGDYDVFQKARKNKKTSDLSDSCDFGNHTGDY